MSELETGMHYPIDLQALPAAWAKGYIGDFFHKVQSGFACGQHNSSAQGVVHIRPMNITRDGRLDFEDVRFVPPDYDERRLESGDVLFNNTNSPALIGKTTFIDKRAAGLAFSNHMTRLNLAHAVDPKFAALQLHFLWMTGYFLHRCVKHVNQASVSSKELERTVPLVAPPIGEQERIVLKVEELFSTLDKSVEYLRTAQVQLKVYRQSLLKHAFEGKLTEKWREENDSSLDQVALQRTTNADRVIPRSWKVVRIGDVLESINNGYTPKADKLYPGRGEIPFIKVYNLTFDGTLNFGKDPTFISNETHRNELKRSECIPGDVLINIVGPPLGKVSIVPERYPLWNINQAIVRFRPNTRIRPKYLAYLLQDPLVRRGLESTSKATAGQFNIKVTTCRDIQVPLCSVNEQDQIIDELECRLSRCLELETQVVRAVDYANALRQSILKQAFSGKLVPQNSNDEPATVLLERIKAAQTNGASHANGNGSHKRTAKKIKKAKKA